MSLQTVEGKKVTLRSSLGQIQRILVKDLGEIVLVCREEEYAQAVTEGREPVTIGFPRVDIVN